MPLGQGLAQQLRSRSCVFKHKLREELWRKWEESHGKKGGEGEQKPN